MIRVRVIVLLACAVVAGGVSILGLRAVVDKHKAEITTLKMEIIVRNSLLDKCNTRVEAFKKDTLQDELLQSVPDQELRRLVPPGWMLP